MAKSPTIDLGTLAFDTTQVDPQLAKTYAKLGNWLGNVQSKLNNLSFGFDETKLRAEEARVKAWAQRVSTELSTKFRAQSATSRLAGSFGGMGSDTSEIDAAVARSRRMVSGSSGFAELGRSVGDVDQRFMRFNRTIGLANMVMHDASAGSSVMQRSMLQLVGVAEQARLGMYAFGLTAKQALIGTGIGAVVVGIGYAFEKLNEKIKATEESYERLAKEPQAIEERLSSARTVGLETRFRRGMSDASFLPSADRLREEAELENRKIRDSIKAFDSLRKKAPEGSGERAFYTGAIVDLAAIAANNRKKAEQQIRDEMEETRRESERAYSEFNQQQRDIVSAYEDRITAERKLKTERLSGSAQSILQQSGRFRPSDFEQDPTLAAAMREQERNESSPGGRVFSRDLGSLNKGLAGALGVVDSGNGQKIERNTALTASAVEKLLSYLQANGTAVALAPGGGSGLSSRSNN